MHFSERKELFRRYIHVGAVLKHFAPRQNGKPRHVAQEPDRTRTLIEQSSRSQAGKWRNYVKAKGSGSDCPPRPDAA
jgi:hypothetical protein